MLRDILTDKHKEEKEREHEENQKELERLAPKAAKVAALFRESFGSVELINSKELPNWKDIAKTYKGVKIKFDRKWMPKDDS